VDKPKDIDKVEIILGAHNLSNKLETKRQVFRPKEFIIHPEWDHSKARYENDIAMIRLSESASYDLYVEPICLKQNGKILQNGKTVGWGATDDHSNTFSSVPMVLGLEASDLLECLLNIDKRLVEIASISTFCAKSSTAGVCKGDSGSSFYIEKNGKNFLQGIVSSNLATKCSERAVAVYTDVVSFIDFIKVHLFCLLYMSEVTFYFRITLKK
jgi:secreted trypsin-like serine protease